MPKSFSVPIAHIIAFNRDSLAGAMRVFPKSKRKAKDSACGVKATTSNENFDVRSAAAFKNPLDFPAFFPCGNAEVQLKYLYY